MLGKNWKDIFRIFCVRVSANTFASFLEILKFLPSIFPSQPIFFIVKLYVLGPFQKYVLFYIKNKTKNYIFCSYVRRGMGGGG